MCRKLCMRPNSTLLQGCLPYFILQSLAILASIDYGGKGGFHAMESTLYHCIVGLFIESSMKPNRHHHCLSSLPTTTSTTMISSIGSDIALLHSELCYTMVCKVSTCMRYSSWVVYFTLDNQHKTRVQLVTLLSYIQNYSCPSVCYWRSAEMIWPRDTRGCISGHRALT